MCGGIVSWIEFLIHGILIQLVDQELFSTLQDNYLDVETYNRNKKSVSLKLFCD